MTYALEEEILKDCEDGYEDIEQANKEGAE